MIALVKTAPKNENGDPICPFWSKNKLYESGVCGGKIIRKKKAYATFVDIGHMLANPPEGGRVGEVVEWWVYECENKHKLYRPKEWADVPEEPITEGYYRNDKLRWPEEFYDNQTKMREEFESL